MTYGVEELAREAGLSIDTIRFYQAQGILDRPKRVGRKASYGERHLSRLHRICDLKARGLTLAGIKRVVGPGKSRSDSALIGALTEGRGARRFDRAGLAKETGVPEALIEAVERSGLVEPLRDGGGAAYDEADVELARAALAVLKEGLPLQELLGLANDHAGNIREIADRAASLFDTHVRHDGSGGQVDPEEVVDAFRRLLPAVTSLVAHHFQRTLVCRALERLEKHGDASGLEQALEASQSTRLAIRWN
ncbi:MAG: MerR family transcriptional regulator [Candidatus Binatia bacterium]|nr:MerR family transcriptional regulator [Candidatus Binatia bacterium]